MLEEINFYLEETKESMEKAILHFEAEVSKIRAGKASPSMLDGIMVDYYGSQSPISQVANINSQDSKTLVIKPWEKAMLEPIEKSILAANLGVTPQNDGDFIRIILPPLTEERRLILIKQIKNEGEKGKISIRSVRKESNEYIKKLSNDGASEDEIRTGEDQIQKITNSYIEKIDNIIGIKEKELITI